MYVFELVGASARTSQSITATESTILEAWLVEIKGAGNFDADATPATGTSTTPLSNGITTTNANDFLLAVLKQQNNVSGSIPSFSSLTSGFSQCASQLQADDGVASTMTSLCAYKIVSATQSGTTCGCTSSLNKPWIAMLLAYQQAAAVVATPGCNQLLMGI